MKNRKIKNLGKITLISIIIVFLIYLIFTIVNINKYLKEYGYGIKELPKAMAVYFRLSKGFTIEEMQNNQTMFIGRHDIIFYYNYYNLSNKYYNKIDQFGDSISIPVENNKHINITGTNKWCHWFKIYVINDIKIEDFKLSDTIFI